MRLSFVKGKGSLNHNNRVFISKNIDVTRIKDNVVYVQKDLKEVYEDLFGQAILENNKGKKPSRQPYKDSEDYLEKISHSKMNQKPFYENLVQIGTMHDSGCGSEMAKLTSEVLDEYVKTFQERNPNLYLFNAVLHLDEATPHLHMDYVPIKHSKRGMSVQNSLTGALKEQGFIGVDKNLNSTVLWQRREREYIRELCMKHGIELEEEMSTDRDSISPEQYRIAAETSEKRVEEIMRSEKPTLRKKFGVVTNYGEVIESIQKENAELKAYKEYNQQIERNIKKEVNSQLEVALLGDRLRISQKEKEVEKEKEKLNKLIVEVEKKRDGLHKKEKELDRELESVSDIKTTLKSVESIYERNLEKMKVLESAIMYIFSLPFFQNELKEQIVNKFNLKEFGIGMDQRQRRSRGR